MNGKSGNINNVCSQMYPPGTRVPGSELICVFDADQVASKEFFMKTIPMFDGGKLSVYSLCTSSSSVCRPIPDPGVFLLSWSWCSCIFTPVGSSAALCETMCSWCLALALTIFCMLPAVVASRSDVCHQVLPLPSPFSPFYANFSVSPFSSFSARHMS